MLNEIEIQYLKALLTYSYLNGCYNSDIWFSADMHYVIMFHVSDVDFRFERRVGISTYVLYSMSMLKDMWSTYSCGKRVCHMVNILEIPLEIAPAPVNGDYWCNQRGGAAILDERRWKFVKILSYTRKELVADKLNALGYFLLNESSKFIGTFLCDALVGRKIFLGINYTSESDALYHVNRCLDCVEYKSKLYRYVTDIYKELRNLKLLQWNRPIFISTRLSEVYIPLGDNATSEYKCIYMSRHRQGKVSYSTVLNYVKNCNVFLLQSFRKENIEQIFYQYGIDEESVPGINCRLYKNTFYDLFEDKMLSDLVKGLEE